MSSIRMVALSEPAALLAIQVYWPLLHVLSGSLNPDPGHTIVTDGDKDAAIVTTNQGTVVFHPLHVWGWSTFHCALYHQLLSFCGVGS